jgi:hypothetical protein
MIRQALTATALSSMLLQGASARELLSAHADDKGYIDVQKLTCAQLAGAFQEDADRRMPMGLRHARA